MGRFGKTGKMIIKPLIIPEDMRSNWMHALFNEDLITHDWGNGQFSKRCDRCLYSVHEEEE